MLSFVVVATQHTADDGDATAAALLSPTRQPSQSNFVLPSSPSQKILSPLHPMNRRQLSRLHTHSAGNVLKQGAEAGSVSREAGSSLLRASSSSRDVLAHASPSHTKGSSLRQLEQQQQQQQQQQQKLNQSVSKVRRVALESGGMGWGGGGVGWGAHLVLLGPRAHCCSS